jgi:hypothetical protein
MPKLSRCKKLGSNIIDARGHFAEARHRREAARFREFAALARQIPLDVLKSILKAVSQNRPDHLAALPLPSGAHCLGVIDPCNSFVKPQIVRAPIRGKEHCNVREFD